MFAIPKSLAWLLAAVHLGVAFADPPAIILPEVVPSKKEDLPAPKADPKAPIILEPGSMYVFQARVPVHVLSSNNPGGVVKWSVDEGPIKIKSRFANKPYEFKSEVFKEKFVYQVESVKPGTEELIVVPIGEVDQTKIVRLLFQVGPAPPKPDEPKPIDPKPAVTSFRVFLIYESGATYSSAVNSVLYGSVVEEWLNANCTGGKAGWRRRDKDLSGDADPTMAAMWNAIKPNVTTIPCVGVEVNGKVELIPLEATPAAMVKKLESYKGAK